MSKYPRLRLPIFVKYKRENTLAFTFTFASA
jgi:hypothetical protein